MALTKAKLIADGVIVAANLHSSHGITSANIGENTNLYFTNARARSAISVSGNALSYNSSTGVITSNFEESPTFTGTVTVSGDLLNISGVTPELKLTDSDDSNYALYSYTDGDLLISTNHGDESGAADTIRFANNGATERMRITSTGAVLIGQTTTVSDHQLTVNGRIGGPTFSDSYLQFTGGNIILKANDDIKLGYNQNVIIKQSGSIGIGTTSPSEDLDISSTGPGIRLTDTTTSGLYHSIRSASDDLLIEADPANVGANTEIEFSIDGSERMRINSSGRVGIGTTGPDRLLDVSGTGNVYTKVQSTNSTAAGIELKTAGGSTENWLIQADESVDGLAIYDLGRTAYRMAIDDGGNVGIGVTSPTQKLDVVGSSGDTNIRVYDASANSEVGIKLQGDAKTWQLQNWGSGGDNLRLLNNAGNIVQLWDDNGNVAIGNFNDPDRTLDVRGTGMSIYGTGDYTELMLRGQVEGTGTIRNVGSWHWSIRGDIGGDNDDLKLARFVTGSYAGIAMQVQNSTGDIFFGNTVVNPASGFSNQRGFGYDNSTGNVQIAATSGNALTVGRNESSDGAIMTLRKESNVKHSFGSTTSYLLGNVGIGLTSPGVKLEIQDSTHTTMKIRSGNNDNILFAQALQSDEARIGTDTNSAISFFTNTSRRMTITTSGNVGIGTNLPSHNLEISGVGGDSTPLLQLTSSASDTYNWISSAMHANLASGETSVHLFGQAESEKNSGYIGYLYSSSGSNSNAVTIGHYAANHLVNILASGNVGLGTTAPSRKLYVVGNALIDGVGNTNKGTLMLGPQTGGAGKWSVLTGAHYNATSGSGNGSGSAGIMLIGSHAKNGENDVVIGGSIYEANAATSIQFWTHTTDTSTAGGSERMRITSAGNVGIGTNNPGAKFEVNTGGGSTAFMVKNSSGLATYNEIDGGYSNLYLYQTGGGAKVVLNSNGNSYFNGGSLGIGVTSPLAKLHIHGTGDLIRATSTNTGQGGAQMDLIHHTTSPANNDIHGVINFGGYYSGTSQSYGSSLRSVWTDVGNQHGQLQFYTRDGSDFNERAKIDMHGHASRVKHASNSSADVVNTTFTEDLTTFQGHGKKYLGMFVIRDGSRYLDVAINSTANNVMYYIYVIGYLYNRGTYIGVTSGYTYTNNSIINHNSGDILDLGVAKSIVSYRGTNSTAGNYTGYLCFRFDSGGNGYSEGQLQVYISSHSLSWQKFADVHAVVQNDTTNNYFAQ